MDSMIKRLRHRRIAVQSCSVVVFALFCDCQSFFHHQGPSDTVALFYLTSIAEAEGAYHQRFGRYASLQDLGPPGVGLINANKARGELFGYTITLKLVEDNYILTATPEVLDSAHPRSFYCDASGNVRHQYGSRLADASSPLVPRQRLESPEQ